MSKRSLMLSTAAVALLTGTAFADTKIDSSKTEPYTTGALVGSQTGQANAGNITITSTGSVAVSAAQGALTVNTANYVLQQGILTNKDNASASAIHVVLSSDLNAGSTPFTNAAGANITGTGIYLDSGSNTALSGSGSGKSGIYLDAASCSSTPCTYTGAITLAQNSSLSVTGDSSQAINISSGAKLVGNLTIGGSVTATSSSTSQTTTSMFGLYDAGTIEGNVIVDTSGQLAAYGHGAEAMVIGGGGVVNGYIQIKGSVLSSVTTQTITSSTQQINYTTNPEAKSGIVINGSVDRGVSIWGPSASGDNTASAQVSLQGQGPAIYIAPTQSLSNLTIGAFTGDTADPGFSFYNRGSVKASWTNYNASTIGIQMAGSSTAHTVLSGGFFNSGTISAVAQSNGAGQASTGVIAIGMSIGDYVELNMGSSKIPAGTSTPGDQAVFVNSGASGNGVISGSVSGSRGGLALGIVIGSQAGLTKVSSMINTGTIGASATTTDATLAGNITNSTTPLTARAIVDASGSLISIYNAGTIQAIAGYQPANAQTVSPLDNNSQLATAIDLSSGNNSTPSGDGVSIINHSSGSRAAIISGNIVFGTGDNQILDLLGDGSNEASVTGNVVFGVSKSRTSSGDKLIVGSDSSLTGAVITGETVRGGGVAVDVRSGGTLTLLNNSDTLKPLHVDCAQTITLCTLNATTFNVASGGVVNLGLNRSLVSTGVVAAQSVNFAPGSILGIAYASYLPQSATRMVMMSADSGQLNIDQSTLDAFNNNATPYLLTEAKLCVTSQPGCARPDPDASSKDFLIVSVIPKTPAQIGLNANSIALAPTTTAGGTATTLFEQANIALGADNELGAAFINGIHNAKEAQQAYNNMAPNLTGGTRAIAISITDQATGPVGARQRALRMYGKANGEMTLWGQEFVQMIKDPGQGSTDVNTGFKTQPGFKDHGFGFAIGMDGGSPKYGWYGGALTFYAGDVNELSRNSHQNQQWYLLSLYSSWRGTGLFLDTKLDAGYGHIDGKRSQILPITSTQVYTRTAENKHAGALISGGISTGAMMSYGAATFMPQLSLDGLYLREEGYTEKNPGTTTVGDGFDLKVGQYYAKSLRAFVGFDARYDLELWDFFLQPEARAGYRYDFINDPTKLKVAFAYANTTSTTPQPGTEFTLTGPDPSQGNFVFGGSISATTDTWTLGLNFDMVKGTNGAFQQVATVHLLGRI